MIYYDTHTSSKGIILSGSPYSVYDADAPHVDPEIFNLDVPILGICYGLQVNKDFQVAILFNQLYFTGNGLESQRKGHEE